MKKLEKSFFLRPADVVAKDILGAYLIRNFSSKKRVVVKIVETEAYMGIEDKGSHSYGGKVTERNKTMYLKGGVFYVYKIYGIYYCLNVVVDKKEKPHAVLIRAVEPLKGLDILKKNRKLKAGMKIKNLTNGPGPLSQALDIDLKFNGSSVCGQELYISKELQVKAGQIVAAKRINIDYAQECKDLPLRFYLRDSGFVSVK